MEAADRLSGEGMPTRVVSMPSWELFEGQDDDYRSSVLLEGVPRLAVEAASPFGWERWADDAVGLNRFRASAPGAEALEKLGVQPRQRWLIGRAVLIDRMGADGDQTPAAVRDHRQSSWLDNLRLGVDHQRRVVPVGRSEVSGGSRPTPRSSRKAIAAGEDYDEQFR